MKFSDRIQLTFIPSGYWTAPLSNFKITTKTKRPPEHSSFFFMWLPAGTTETELIKEIKITFPSIPALKLIACQINLAFPLDENYFKIENIIGKIIPIPPAINLLFNLEIIETQDVQSKISRYSDSVKSWAFLVKFIHELLNRGNFIPVLTPKDENHYEGKWKFLLKSQLDNERFKEIIKSSPWSAYNLPINFIPKEGAKNNMSYKTNGLWHPSFVFSDFMDRMGDFLIRTTLKKSKFTTFNDFYSHEIKKEKDIDTNVRWDYKFLKSIILQDNLFEINEFHETIIPSILSNWVQTTQGSISNPGVYFTIELKYPKNPEDDWPLKMYLTLQDSNKNLPLNNLIQGKITEKKKVLEFFKDDAQLFEFILRALGNAAKIFPPIKNALQGKIPDIINLDSSEVMNFLRYPRYILVQNGFNVVLPDIFTKGGKQRLSARLVIKSKDIKQIKTGVSDVNAPIFELNTMLDYKWEVILEDKELTSEEFDEVINSNEPLINWRGDWILIDQQDIEDLRTIFQMEVQDQHFMKAHGNMNYMDALKLGLTGKYKIQEGGTEYEVHLEGNIEEIVERLSSLNKLREIACSKKFKGTLRPYQETGLTWLGNMCDLSFGVCLADDMGLGKTIQVIAFLLYHKEEFPKEPGSILIICPMSVLYNWMREIKKFGPSLDVVLHHGSNRIKDAKNISEYLKPHRIILTSFGTIRNDIEFFETIPLSGVIVDESQNMKNYTSQQTKAIYKLQSMYRICLSGTPIENRMMELWTLFEFLNPGLLGKRSEFQKNYVLPIERFQDEDVIRKLKRIISPFILRRVKSDKTIISDLPEKNEMKVYLDLSQDQILLYKDIVEKTLKEIESSTTDDRKKRGLVLKLITQLKQICNHPFQYSKKQITANIKNEELFSQSKKLDRLIDMIEEVISNGEKILIFTQFKQMGDIIFKVLERIYSFPILFFHGGVSAKKRKEIVDNFQSKDIDSPPILILSLKAGGTGLNLTQGTIVIHFDRWWNPAVEDQATDRVYRIGQTKMVNVYKFISIGTIEEKIDALLEEKRDLADKIVASTGESWLSDLSNDKLKELLTLEI